MIADQFPLVNLRPSGRERKTHIRQAANDAAVNRESKTTRIITANSPEKAQQQRFADQQRTFRMQDAAYTRQQQKALSTYEKTRQVLSAQEDKTVQQSFSIDIYV